MKEKKLVIVESPSKAKTIGKYLGAGFEVMASVGHIRDLPKSGFGLDIENNFEPKYVEMTDKKDVIKKLKAAASAAGELFLATDPDREGEAISWHLAQVLGLDLQKKCRVEFGEITKKGVAEGMSSPRPIDLNLVDAQQARRVLDRIVGYQLSPFLWKKIRRGLSAGRVQSVAVKLIVDREKEIRAFNPEEYWSVTADLTPQGEKKQAFSAKFHSLDGKKKDLKTKADADEILEICRGSDFAVNDIKRSVRKKSAPPPFSTSSLTQEASRKLGFQARRTMRTAQSLYEGVDINGIGTVGLITYMRTDSLRVSEEARAAAKSFIAGTYGSEYLPEGKGNYYKSKASSQDAHEAVRPTDISLTPEKIAGNLSPDQLKLYRLIFNRFLASQMAPCLLDTAACEIIAKNAFFKASGYTVRFDGFTRIYEEGRDTEEEKAKALPSLSAGDKLELLKITGDQHFTEPPPRFNEASLIKTLEENGVGRPSTYAAIISTVIDRLYVERDGKTLKPTKLGEVTNGLLEERFENIVDVRFTAGMETELDQIGEGKLGWKTAISRFYGPFSETLKTAEEEMQGKYLKVPDEETDVACDLCGKNMVIKEGRFGRFMACSGYPDCKNTKKISKETSGFCPVCGSRVVELKSKKGRIFFGCDKRDCSFITWDIPQKETCPKCSSSLFLRKGRNAGTYCHREGCDFAPPPPLPEKKSGTGDAANEKKEAASKKAASPKKAASAKKPTAKTASKKKPVKKKTTTSKTPKKQTNEAES